MTTNGAIRCADGNWDAGDRGLTAVPGREAEFRASLAKVADYGAALQCDTVHSMAGVVDPGQDYQAAERVYVENLRYAAGYLESQGMAVVIEPINKKMGIVKSGPAYTTASLLIFSLAPGEKKEGSLYGALFKPRYP